MTRDELWIIQRKRGKQPWRIALYFPKFYSQKEAREQVEYQSTVFPLRKYRAIKYVPARRAK